MTRLADTAQRSRLARRIVFRIVAPLAFLEVLNSLDRVNVSFAALRMNADIGLSAEAYGLGAGLFFIGYLLFQVPSGMLLRAAGARAWLFFTVLAWGVIASAMAFVENRNQFYILRILLGFAEAGFAPGIVFYIGLWLPERYRAGGISITMMAIPLSVVIGGPLSGLLLGTHVAGLAGWRFMFLAEGLPTLLLALTVPFLFVDGPEQARWLSVDDKQWIGARAARKADRSAHLRQAFGDSAVWMLAVIWFCTLTGAYGIIFWLPLAVKQISGSGELATGMITALPWVCVGAGMVLNARHSDRKDEREWHIALGGLLAAGGLAAAASLSSPVGSLICLCIAGLGLGGAQGVFWAAALARLKSRTPAEVMLINMVGSSGGLVGPYLVGFIRSHTGSFAAPVYGMAGLLLIMTLLAAALPRMGVSAPENAGVAHGAE